VACKEISLWTKLPAPVKPHRGTIIIRAGSDVAGVGAVEQAELQLARAEREGVECLGCGFAHRWPGAHWIGSAEQPQGASQRQRPGDGKRERVAGRYNII
jgi:hypothetical protein